MASSWRDHTQGEFEQW